jgi:PAS domain S-box-containing protein
MDYTLEELLDIPTLRYLLDSLDEIHSMPSAIIDTEGNVLIATAWQDICTNFHRMNPDTEKMCIESDRNIEARLGEHTPHVVYRCPMGLVDSATPIIIEGKHLGNVFTGQLFLEPPDESYFIKQARKFGFDEDEYLAAMRKVPMFSEETLHKNLTFIADLAQMLAEQGLQHKRQCEAEASLRESELNYRTLADSGQALIWKARPDKLCDYFNKVWLDFTGRTYEQEFGNGWAECVHPDDFQHCLETYITAFDKREAFSMDYRLRRHDGEYRWLQDDGCPRYDMNGTFSGYIGYCLDITDRKMMEEKLLHASEEWRETFDTIPDMITILDSEHRIVRANRATWQKLGCEMKDLLGKPCYTFFHGTDSPPETYVPMLNRCGMAWRIR